MGLSGNFALVVATTKRQLDSPFQHTKGSLLRRRNVHADEMGPLLALSSSPPPRLDNSPSNMSSPLSDVEDKDADHEEMELRMRLHAPDRLGTPKRSSHDADEDSDVDAESDDESKLSEMDINDSEAETERLYDTPQKEKTTRDVLGVRSGVGSRQFVDRRDRVFERSPSKLQQQLQAELDAENGASDNESLSEAEEEEDDDELSRASSEAQPDPKPTKDRPRRSPSQPKKKSEPIASATSSNSNLTSQESQDSRKRKRSSVAGQSEQEQPLRKRTGSIGVPEGDFSADDAVIADDEGGVSTNPQSGTHTGEEDNSDPPAVLKNKEDPVASVEDDVIDTPRSRNTRRGSAKKWKSKSPQRSGGQGTEGAHNDPPDDGDDPAAEDAVDEHAADADEEAEAAHRNEEERMCNPATPLQFGNSDSRKCSGEEKGGVGGAYGDREAVQQLPGKVCFRCSPAPGDNC